MRHFTTDQAQRRYRRRATPQFGALLLPNLDEPLAIDIAHVDGAACTLRPSDCTCERGCPDDDCDWHRVLELFQPFPSVLFGA